MIIKIKIILATLFFATIISWIFNLFLNIFFGWNDIHSKLFSFVFVIFLMVMDVVIRKIKKNEIQKQ